MAGTRLNFLTRVNKMHRYVLIIFLFSSSQSIAQHTKNIEKTPFTFYSLRSATNFATKIEKSTEDIIFQMIFKQLPEYNLSFKKSNYETALNNIEKSSNSCLRNIIKTSEREKSFLFSKPQTLFLGLRLYYNPHLPPSKIQEIKGLPLQKVFDIDNKLTIGIEKGRAYGSKLTEQLDRLPHANKFFKVGSDGQNLMIYMLLKGRFDMMFEYPEVMNYKRKQMSSNDQLYSASLPNMEPLIFGRIACSKSESSKKLLSKIDKILTNIYKSEEYKVAHLELVKDKNQVIFNQLYNNFLNDLKNK
jgi:uncharacterized protein (TIGR02285 family)